MEYNPEVLKILEGVIENPLKALSYLDPKHQAKELYKRVADAAGIPSLAAGGMDKPKEGIEERRSGKERRACHDNHIGLSNGGKVYWDGTVEDGQPIYRGSRRKLPDRRKGA